MIKTEIHKRLAPSLIIFAFILMLCGIPALALDISHYAGNSRLASGKWATVKISETGMHLITDATLRNLGFTDPAKVKVYGTGGGMVPEALSADMPDDLPLLPSARTSKGIIFFANNHVSWKPGEDETPYSHVINPYSEENIYFLSDSEPDTDVPSYSYRGSGARRLGTFTARTLHERDLHHLGESGRNYLGEDFRSTRSQIFTLPLTGNAGKDVTLAVRFATNVTGGSSTLSYKANGSDLKHVSDDNISAVYGASYATFSTSVRSFPLEAEKLDLTVTYNQTGTLFLARLDYIEAFYTRQLALSNGELHFYGTFTAGTTLAVTGCSAETRIFDVTSLAVPGNVEYDLDGTTALVTIPADGYYEFVAFNPDKITRAAVAGSKIANQNLHAMQAPDYLIISNQTYRDGAEIIAGIHRSKDSLNVEIIDPQLIYNEFSGGKKDISAFRKLLKMWHDRGGAPKYCLIMGKPSYDNKIVMPEIQKAGYTPMPIWQSATGLMETSSFSNDDYIGMLDDADEATFKINRAAIHVAVGRLPVTSAEESRTVAEKIRSHALNPSRGAWRNKIMIIADDADNNEHFNQAQQVYNNLRGYPSGAGYLYDRVYLDAYELKSSATGLVYPQATERMLSNYNEGVALTNYIGHAAATSWGHEQLWTWPQITSMANPNLTFIYAATCRFCPWDESGTSGGEHLMLNPEGGIVGMIAASRTVYISSNGVLNRLTAEEWFRPGIDGLPRRLGDVYVAGKNKYPGDDNKLRYIFMGDPAMRLNDITYRVRIDSIAGQDLLTAEEMPTIEAGRKVNVSGCLLTPDGAEASDFNGSINLQLYDAETVIRTHGNGSNGIPTVYNDRTTRLASVNAKVEGGRWDAQLIVPLEIANNYSPALISAYAHDEHGSEANGYSDSFYVYGYAEDEEHDTQGPEIEYFRLNSPDFADGDRVNPNAVVFARISDPSGINISDGGIGHKISLRLDEEVPYDDVALYFKGDTDSGTGGTLAYPLKDVAPGNHTLMLEVWDNYNNASRDTLSFTVSAAADPYIIRLTTDVNPASSGVNFILDLDQPNTKMDVTISVSDLNGRVVWESERTQRTDYSATLSTYWNLCDKSGVRVPRGIYLYRAKVVTPQGTWASKTNKLAVTAQ